MRYKLKLNHHSEFEIFELNKLNARNYFIPHSSLEGMKKTTFYNERKLSDKIILLNGEWEFRYYDKCNDMPEEFDTASEELTVVTVPSTWQRTGFEHPNYLNARYQFPLNPPVIPQNCPCGVYVKNVEIDKTDKTYLINFLGVCSCFDLFVNGKFVGYSEGSHNTAEFDITSYLHEGCNEIVVVVYKWCNGSYLECQDMFRENGIFRDVFIIKEAEGYLYDFGYDTEYNEDGTYDFSFDYELRGETAGLSVEFSLTDKRDGKVIVSDSFTAETAKKTYPSLSVHEWTAETPDLYDLTVTVLKEGKLISATHKNAGFKHIEIKGTVYYFNNKNIKLFGVNHHESHPEHGYTMTVEELERDVRLIKAYNGNAVRLSHYIHDPLFLTLCDEYGLYTIDEMDLECHGVYSNPLNANFYLISDKVMWAERFLDRAHRMYYRDRCHASIALWSLGNEAGGDKCQDLCYDFIREHSSIPVQYEGATHTKRFCYDVVAVFYPSHATLHSIADETIKDKRYLSKPYFMSEYSHAMGMGPGGLNDTIEIVLGNDRFMGGCIWEFCDHVAINKDGKYRYTYGGDYNEKKHDGNFCVDGLFFADRSPSTGALNMRECYRPIRCTRDEADNYTFTNYRSFTDSSDIDISWTLLRNGEPMNSGKVDIVIPAESSVTTQILCPIPRDMSEYTMQLTYTQGDRYVASEDFAITQPITHTFSQAEPEYKVEDKILTATTDGGEIQISLKSGEILSYKVGAKELINSAPRLGKRGILPNMWRLTIDNDRFIKIGWAFLGTLKAKPRHISTKLVTEGGLKVVSRYSIRGYGRLATCTVTKTINKDGGILVDVTMKRGLKLLFYSDIVRCGVTMELDKSLDNVTYYGLGERETLSDFDEHGKLGIYSLKVRDMHEAYVKPQESGNRSKVRWATLTDGKGYGVRVDMTDMLLNINANHYTRNDIENATHMEDVPEACTTCLQVDGFVRGTGSQSCGPQPTAEHRPNLKKPLHYSFIISPIKPE